MGHSNDGQVGDFLITAGKALCCVAQQRIQLQPCLHRMFDKMDTFHTKAFDDTQNTIEGMEKQRTTYRAALLWMKSLSDKLDPESMDQLSKFRKVQAHCRRCKLAFEQQSVDCVQKIEMLNASRCNLLGHSLETYQTSWIKFWNRSTSTFNCIAQCFDNYEKEIKRSSERVIERQVARIEDAPSNVSKELKQNIPSVESAPEETEQLIDLQVPIDSESADVEPEDELDLLKLNDNFGDILEKALQNVTKLSSSSEGIESKLTTLKTSSKQELLDQFLSSSSTAGQSTELDDLMTELNLIELDRTKLEPINDLWMFDDGDTIDFKSDDQELGTSSKLKTSSSRPLDTSIKVSVWGFVCYFKFPQTNLLIFFVISG
jgi:hypothetical protein